MSDTENDLLKNALDLAEKGFWIFPLRPGSKLPAIKAFTEQATRDPAKIKNWWASKNYNIGIATSKFDQFEALLVLDIDEAGKKNGEKELLALLSQENLRLPVTFSVKTPTGGKHLFFKNESPLKQGVNVLAPGIDTRSKGGYAVGPGSIISGEKYVEMNRNKVVPVPEWLKQKLLFKKSEIKIMEPVISAQAKDRAIDYLEKVAPLAIEGFGGDQTTYKVVCAVKDFGVSKEETLLLMSEHWNERCDPPWELSELKNKVDNAYNYGNYPQGVNSPEAHFDKIEDPNTGVHPFKELNKNFAFITLGGGAQILWETKNAKGVPKTEYLSIPAFHDKFASWKMDLGGSQKQVTRLWMASKERRSYDGVCFLPGKKASDRFYNLWKGFSNSTPPKTITDKARKSVQLFLEHIRTNVCGGKEELNEWLVGWFAHLIQKPWEKSKICVVFQGSKGVGKSFVFKTIGALLKSHFIVSSSRRYLLGNFNAHLENCLLFVLEEAFWSGDKQAEGTLKDLITGDTHQIERKGKEAYTVDNLTRVAVLGNEDWLVPASHDERRYAVFEVGDSFKQNQSHFKFIQEGMNEGGYALLFQHLNQVDISKLNVDYAPETEGLIEQKISTLSPFYQYWFECIERGSILFSRDPTWPENLNCSDLRDAFSTYCDDRKIRSRLPDIRLIGKMVKKCIGQDVRVRVQEDGQRHWTYDLPELSICRERWKEFIGQSGGLTH